jgi:hypothetical protein
MGTQKEERQDKRKMKHRGSSEKADLRLGI